MDLTKCQIGEGCREFLQARTLHVRVAGFSLEQQRSQFSADDSKRGWAVRVYLMSLDLGILDSRWEAGAVAGAGGRGEEARGVRHTNDDESAR